MSISSAKTIFQIAAAVAVLATTSSVFAAVGYSTSFDDFDPAGTLSGSSGSSEGGSAPVWDTNDARTFDSTTPGVESVGQSDFVGVISGYSSSTSDYRGLLGGSFRGQLAPGSSPVFLFRPFDVSVANGGTGRFLFNVDFAISSSQTPYANSDSFAWTIRNGDTTLLSLRFAPNTDPTLLNVFLDSAQGTVNSGLAIGRDSKYHLQINIDPDSTADVAITQEGTPITTSIFSNANVTGSGVAPDQVTNAAATWILADPVTTGANGAKTGAGSNAMIFNNYSAVPEPSSIAMMGMAGLGGLFVMAKRRKQLSK